MNEREVLRALEPLGFGCYRLETMPLAEQISLFHRADLRVDPVELRDVVEEVLARRVRLSSRAAA